MIFVFDLIFQDKINLQFSAQTAKYDKEKENSFYSNLQK